MTYRFTEAVKQKGVHVNESSYMYYLPLLGQMDGQDSLMGQGCSSNQTKEKT